MVVPVMTTLLVAISVSEYEAWKPTNSTSGRDVVMSTITCCRDGEMVILSRYFAGGESAPPVRLKISALRMATAIRASGDAAGAGIGSTTTTLNCWRMPGL